MISYFKVKGQSMEPLCKEGDFILLDKMSYLIFRPKAGDTIVLRHPQQSRLLLKYVMQEKFQDNRFFYWVEGLNKKESSDSRAFGWVPKDFIFGKAIVVSNKEQKIPALAQ
jgi:nickel-type superoxide dismutase maturation protease